jgi:hypothetical protein
VSEPLFVFDHHRVIGGIGLIADQVDISELWIRDEEVLRQAGVGEQPTIDARQQRRAIDVVRECADVAVGEVLGEGGVERT